jgi:hypothetical protein
MSPWSREDAIAMERRHVLEGAKRVARQKALVGELIAKRHDRLVQSAEELLVLLQTSLGLSKARLADLENEFRPPSNGNWVAVEERAVGSAKARE